jgi:thiaminase
MILATILATILAIIAILAIVSKVQEKHYKTETSRRIYNLFVENYKSKTFKEISKDYSEAFNRPVPWPLSWYWKIMGVR